MTSGPAIKVLQTKRIVSLLGAEIPCQLAQCIGSQFLMIRILTIHELDLKLNFFRSTTYSLINSFNA